MKNSKIVCALLAGIMMISALCACSSGKATKDTEERSKPAAETKAEEEKADNTAAKDSGVKMSTSDGYIIFKVDPSFNVIENSWMGICPAGKSYKTEGEADEDDIMWTSPEYVEEGKNKPFEFWFYEEDITGIEDGEYTMVLCEDDGLESSKCFFYFPITIKGSKINADFSKIVIN